MRLCWPLATTLHVYAKGLVEAKEKLSDLAPDISTTAGALIQLQDAINADQARSASQNGTRVFKDEGVKEIENVAAQCAQIYATIVIVVTKAGALKSKGKTAASFGEMPILKSSSLLRTLRMPWLEPRITRIEEQLRWLKMKVLLNLQLAGIAKVQLGIPERAPGSFDEELALRKMAHRIRRREAKYLEEFAIKYQITEILVDSPFNSSTISGFVTALPEDVPPRNPFHDTAFPADNDQKQVTSPDVTFPERVNEIKEEPVKPITPQSSPKPASSTSRSDTMVQDQQSENGAAAVKDDIQNFKAEVAKPGESSTTKLQAETSTPANTKDNKAQEETADNKQSADKAPAISSLPGFGSQQSILPSWIKKMFGQGNKASNQSDWESQALEAYIIPEDSKTVVDIPLGHQTLSRGLRKKQCLTWDQYTALGSQHHKRISQAVAEAKRLDLRERTCVAIGLNKQFGSERIILFFLVGAPVEPIYFTDAVSRKFSFPYEQSRTWPLMKTLIDQAFLHVDVIGSHVVKGYFDLVNEDGKIILKDVFDTMVSPGCKITQHMWPMPSPPNKPFNGPPGPSRPGPCPPGQPPVPCGGRPPPPPSWFPGGPPPGSKLLGPSHPPHEQPIIFKLKPNPPKPQPNCRTDGSSLVSDSDIEDEPEDLGLEIDFDEEKENSKLNLGELLAKFTNATDTVCDNFLDDEDSSDNSSDYSSSFTD